MIDFSNICHFYVKHASSLLLMNYFNINLWGDSEQNKDVLYLSKHMQIQALAIARLRALFSVAQSLCLR